MVTGKTQLLLKGRQADSARRRARVLEVIGGMSRAGERGTVTGVARAAGVDRAFLYRHPDLLAMVQDAETGLPVSCGCPCHAVLAADLQLLQDQLAGLRKQLGDLLAEGDDLLVDGGDLLAEGGDLLAVPSTFGWPGRPARPWED
jgi:hypothetical protein